MGYKDPEKNREFQREWARKRYAQMRQTTDELKAGGCVLCGETFLGALDFHHKDPSLKSFTIGSRTGRKSPFLTPDDIKKEAAKCVVLCRNCHAKVHAGVCRIDGTESVAA